MEKEIKNTTPENERCDFCGQLVFTAVACPWTGGAVHMTHCPECKYFEPIFWHCLYRENDKKVVG